jgi:hypothetical protein
MVAGMQEGSCPGDSIPRSSISNVKAGKIGAVTFPRQLPKNGFGRCRKRFDADLVRLEIHPALLADGLRQTPDSCV